MTNPIAAIQRAAAAVQRRTREWPATLSDANGDVTPNRDATVYTQPGFVYCVMPDGAIAKAFNNRVPPVTGLRVFVGYEPRNKSLFRVLDFNYSYVTLGGLGGGAGTALGPHHKTHEMFNAGGGNDVVFSQARQLMPLRVSPVSGFTVRVESSSAAVAAGWAPSDTGTLDLTADKPVTGALYVLIYLSAAGTLSKRVGSNVGAFVSLDYTDIPARLFGEIALAAVALYQGQTAIQETNTVQDIVDLRFSGAAGNSIPILTTKGDLLTFDTAETRLGVGTNGQVLTADSAQAKGVKWATPAASASDATTTVVGVVLIEQNPPSGHPAALTLIERNTPNGLASVDTDQMLSSMSLPLIGGQATGAVGEASRWVRYASNPLFGGVGSAAAQEPSVLIEDGIFKMWYTSGWASTVINYATSPDGLTWTQYGSNPVLSTHSPCHAYLFKTDGLYWIYFIDVTTNDMYVATSADGIAWGTPALIFAHNAFAWEVAWGNPYIWREGYTWYGLLEYRPTGPLPWQMSLFTSTDGLTWSLVTKPLTSLKPGGVGEVSGAFMMTPPRRHGLYHLWYHGTSINATLPTNLYHATSPDRINWTILNSGLPILTHTGSAPEIDQAADAAIVEWNNKTFLYFEGVDNTVGSSSIEVLTWDGTLAQLIDGAAAAGVGTVTSVALTVPTILSVAGSPITGAGTLAVTLATESANTTLAGPTSGGAATPTFRALVAADLASGADGTKFLRDDMTWQAVSTSGGGDAEAMTRFTGDGAATAFVLPDVAEQVLMVSDNGSVVDPLIYTLGSDGFTLTFDTAPVVAHVLTVIYTLQQL